jgi:hypothetical protein
VRSAFALALALGAAPAAASPCGSPDLKAAFPPDASASVPLNATLSAVYAEAADYLGEPVTITDSAGPRPLDVTFDPTERRLSAPDPGLAANQSYTVVWPALRGISTAAVGQGASVTFTTSATNDVLAPTFTGIAQMTGDLAHPLDDCTDELEPRMFFDFTLGTVDDDGGKESLSLLTFQTQGSELEGGAPKLVGLTAWPASSTHRVELPVEGATGHVCFAAVARDLLFRTSPTGSDEHCVELAEPPFFYGCAVAPGARSSSWFGVLACVLGIVAWRRRR